MPLRSACFGLCAVVWLAACSPPTPQEPEQQPQTPQQPSAADPASAPAIAEAPVTVSVCGQPVQYARVPQRAVTNGVNIAELFLSVGLRDKLVGYSGVRDLKALSEPYRAMLQGVPSISTQGLQMEAILGAQADFVFAGWSYGFRPGAVTPERLQSFGIDAYILTESCIRQHARERVSLEDTFDDMLNLGRIFRREAQAQALVQQQRQQLQAVQHALKDLPDGERPRVWVYDSGTELFTTAGRYGMPHAMIEAAGGTNIFDDLPMNWPRGNWEAVVDRNPQWIVIVDYDRPDAQGKIDFLLGKPELAQVDAIVHKRFVVIPFVAATPGPGNVAYVQVLAQAMHPQRMGAFVP